MPVGAQESLCQPDEGVVFSCSVSRQRLVSLCAGNQVEDPIQQLRYRFGRPGKVELEFPQAPEGSPRRFVYAHYVRARVNETEVSFRRGEYRYTVFSHYRDEEAPEDDQPDFEQYGVRVTLPTGKQHEFICQTQPQDQLWRLEQVVPCDPESPLNLGECS